MTTNDGFYIGEVLPADEARRLQRDSANLAKLVAAARTVLGADTGLIKERERVLQLLRTTLSEVESG